MGNKDDKNNGFKLRTVDCCYDCIYHVGISYCGCHCHDDDACSKYLKIVGPSGSAGSYICDSFEKSPAVLSIADITSKEADMMGFTDYNFEQDS